MKSEVKLIYFELWGTQGAVKSLGLEKDLIVGENYYFSVQIWSGYWVNSRKKLTIINKELSDET